MEGSAPARRFSWALYTIAPVARLKMPVVIKIISSPRTSPITPEIAGPMNMPSEYMAWKKPIAVALFWTGMDSTASPISTVNTIPRAHPPTACERLSDQMSLMSGTMSAEIPVNVNPMDMIVRFLKYLIR